MEIIEVFILAIALSMDAFAVAICKGLSLKKLQVSKMIIVGLYFGIFQALMPFVGYLLGSTFAKYIEAVDHWVAFALLLLIGANMIREAISSKEEEIDDNFSFKSMLILAIATSIDALTIGISFSMEPPAISIYWTVLIIGFTTFILSAIGVLIGNIFGSKFKRPAEITGGIILILLEIKVLLNGLGVISF